MENHTQQEEQKPKRVEDLSNFPFNNFSELKKASIEGVANVGVDRGIALKWAHNGIYSSSWIRTQSLVLAFLPIVAVIAFLIYIIATKSWLLLLFLPVLLVCFFIFHPSSAMTFGFIRTALIGLVFIAFAWSLISDITWLTALTLTLLIIWYAQRTIYKKAINGLIKAVLEHEDLLCLLWSGRVLNIGFYNGNSYWVDWKTEDGQSIHYDNKE